MSKKAYPKLSDFISENYSEKEAAEFRAVAQDEYEQLQTLREDVTRMIAQYMAQQNIGFNEMVRRLAISPSQFSRIQRGDGNITLATLAHIARTTGKKVRIEVE